MSTIKQTAMDAFGGRIPRGWGGRVQAVHDALVEREQVMSDNIIEAGVALGATRDQVAAILADAGMHMSPANDEVEVTDVQAQLDRIEAKVDKAIERGKNALRWARTQGYRKGRNY